MFTRKPFFAVAALALAAMASVAHAKPDALTPFKGELPTVLRYATQTAGLEIFNKFSAAEGLDGWVVKDKASGKNVVIYTTKDGNNMLAGMMIDKTGKNLTSEFTEKYVPAPDLTPAFEDFAKAASVKVGSAKAKAEITVAFDANCGFCKLLHKLVDPAVAAGELRVIYVPVGILGADSNAKAAGILASANPADEINNAVVGRAVSTSTDKTFVSKVTANTNLMRKHGFNGTPTVLYKGKMGGEDTVFVANGVPNMLEMFERLGISGQVETLKKDPSLARYISN